jgi:hypothetical protein
MSTTTPSVRGAEVATAAAWLAVVVLLATGPGLLGWSTPLPESWMDFDPLHRRDVGPYPPFHDLTPMVIDWPRDRLVAELLHRGRLAKWNPYSATGAPLWAEQGGPFFPLKLPFYAFGSLWSYQFFLALRLFTAGLGAYLLARQRGRTHVGAIAAGATFELSGALIEPYPFASFSALYVLPWTVLGAAAIARHRDGASAAAAALAIAVAASGGHPSLVLVVCAAYAAAVAGHAAARWRRAAEAAVIAGWGIAALLLGLALAAPSLLPLAELVRLSTSYKVRPIGELAWTFGLALSRHSLPLALFAPGVLAAMRPLMGTNHAAAAALGVSGLTLAAAGLLRRGLDAALVCVAVLGIALATAPPGLAWIGRLPGLHVILPVYAWPLVALPLTQAVAMAVEDLDTRAARRALLAGLLLVLGGFLSLMLVRDMDAGFGPRPFATAFAQTLAAPSGLLLLVLPPVITAAAIGATVVLRRPRLVSWCGIGLTTLAIAELLVIWPALLQHPRSPALAAGPSPAVRFLQQRLADGDARITGDPPRIGLPFTPMLYGIADVRGTSALPFGRYEDYVLAAGPAATELVLQTIPQLPSPLLDLAAVRYIAIDAANRTPDPLLRGDPQLVLAYQDAAVAIYENRAALPRVRIVHAAQPVGDRAAAQAAITALARRFRHAVEAGIADTVLLEPDAAGAAPPPPAAAPVGDEWVQISDASDPDALVLDAQLAAPGFVVVADTYYPGWSATVDGAPTPIYPANLLFRAVFVPEGRHAIAFRYAPWSLRYGWWIALASAGICTALAIGSRRARVAR